MSYASCCLPLAFLAMLSCAVAKEPSPNTSTARGVLRVPAQANVGGTSIADAKIEFMCTTGNGGVVQVAVILPDAVPGFPLDDFEGPDGIGQSKALATWSIIGTNAMVVPMPVSGWYGVDGDGFLLASSHLSGAESDFARLLRRWVDDGSQPLRLTVKPPGSGASLEARVLPGAYRTRIGVALSQCLAIVRRR